MIFTDSLIISPSLLFLLQIWRLVFNQFDCLNALTIFWAILWSQLLTLRVQCYYWLLIEEQFSKTKIHLVTLYLLHIDLEERFRTFESSSGAFDCATRSSADEVQFMFLFFWLKAPERLLNGLLLPRSRRNIQSQLLSQCSW